MKNLTLLFASLLALVFSGCETVVDLDLEQSPSVLAVEGVLADQAGRSFVKLAMSAPYAKNVEPAALPDAQVTVADNAGNSIPFLHVAGGMYKPAADFKGVTGRSYQLTIRAHGQTYTASSVLNPVPELDDVRYEYVDGKTDDYGRKEGYYVATGFYDAPGIRNYYKLDLRVNDTLKQRDVADIMVSEDRLYDGSHLDEVNIFIPLKKGDDVEVSLLSLTKEAYDFYAAVAAMASQGGLFGRNPANLPTNISNGAVGFFTASAVSAKTVVIE